jgi:hypothetical protein
METFFIYFLNLDFKVAKKFLDVDNKAFYRLAKSQSEIFLYSHLHKNVKFEHF